MTRIESIFNAKSNLYQEIFNAIAELYKAIEEKNPDMYELRFDEYADEGVCDRVGTFIMYNDGETGEWGTFTSIRYDGSEIWLTAEGTDTERYDAAYGFYLEELIAVYEEMMSIYKSLA